MQLCIPVNPFMLAGKQIWILERLDNGGGGGWNKFAEKARKRRSSFGLRGQGGRGGGVGACNLQLELRNLPLVQIILYGKGTWIVW